MKNLSKPDDVKLSLEVSVPFSRHNIKSHSIVSCNSYIFLFPSLSDPPSVSIEGYDNNWYVGRSDAMLVCVANSNPAPTTITWTT